MKRWLLFTFGLFCLLSCFSFSCISPDDKQKGATGELYFDYSVTGEKEGGITVKLAYKPGGAATNGIAPGEGSQVLLDGNVLEADSARRSGIYYEASLAPGDAEGSHTIVLIDHTGSRYEETFFYQPLRLRTALPDTISQADLLLELDEPSLAAYVHITLTDTVFRHDGINRSDTLQEGRILISRAELAQMSRGPLQLDLSTESRKKLVSTTPAGGQLIIYQGLRQELILR